MIAVVLITILSSPPARIWSATLFADASSSAAMRIATASGLMPMLAATASALGDVSADVTTVRLLIGRAATAASSVAASIVLRVWAVSGAASVTAANAATRDSEICFDTGRPLAECGGEKQKNAGSPGATRAID